MAGCGVIVDILPALNDGGFAAQPISPRKSSPLLFLAKCTKNKTGFVREPGESSLINPSFDGVLLILHGSLCRKIWMSPTNYIGVIHPVAIRHTKFAGHK